MAGAQQPHQRNPVAQCAWLTAATLALWVLLLAPAWATAGIDGFEGLSYAALLCLIPGWLVFFVGARYGVASRHSAMLVLAATPFRIVFVLLGTLSILYLRHNLRLSEFVVWVIVFYLATLLLETLFVLRQPVT